MKKNIKNDLDEKFQKILKTSASFDFFIAIHDFVELVESNSSLSKNLAPSVGSNQKEGIPSKYNYLKKVHQGVKDIRTKTSNDLGHDRYMAILELNKIKNKELSDNNSFWKKRELFRKSTGLIYEKLSSCSK
ncbi:MAG: hypothetical protein ABII97_01170 [Patescibacteria group bacterium]